MRRAVERTMRVTPSLCLAALPLLACSTRRPAMVTAPRTSGGKVVAEAVTIACDAPQPERMECDLSARYRTAGAPERVAVESKRAEVQLAGEPEPGVDTPVPAARHYPGTDHLEVAPHDPAALRLDAHLRPASTQTLRFGAAPPILRHGLMARAYGLEECAYDDEGCSFHVDYFPAVRPASVRLRLETGAGVDATVTEAPLGLEGRMIDNVGDGPPERLVVGLRGERRRVSPGGPFVGFGARVHQSSDVVGSSRQVFRWRAGWEMYAPEWVAHAWSVEGDLDGEVMVVPSTELVSSSFLFLPSFGFQLGMPIVVAPELQAGARLGISMGVPYLSFVTLLDLIPPRDDWVRVTTMAQLSF